MCVADWTDWVAAPIYPGKQTVTKIYRDFTGSQSQTAMPAKQSGEKRKESGSFRMKGEERGGRTIILHGNYVAMHRVYYIDCTTHTNHRAICISTGKEGTSNIGFPTLS